MRTQVLPLLFPLQVTCEPYCYFVILLGLGVTRRVLAGEEPRRLPDERETRKGMAGREAMTTRLRVLEGVEMELAVLERICWT